MKYGDLIRNPIFKIVGIGLILYFALFANKHDNRSLRKRYSADNIKKSIGRAVEQKKDIEQKLEKAKKIRSDLHNEEKINEQK